MALTQMAIQLSSIAAGEGWLALIRLNFQRDCQMRTVE
jgi:hypothetical protein